MEIKTLAVRFNYLLGYCIVLTILCGYLFFRISKKEDKVAIVQNGFREMKITDSTGLRRLVFAADLPNPYLNGKEYAREIHPAGVTFYDHKGNECGGIGLNNAGTTEFDLIAFDYDVSDAIAMYKQEEENGSSFQSAFMIKDKPAPGTSPEKAHAAQRITLQDDNRNASLVISDTKGKPRIVLSVDSNDNARITLMDKEGKPLKQME